MLHTYKSRKVYWIGILLIFIVQQGFGQQCAWVQKMLSDSETSPQGIHVDSRGNVYFLGWMSREVRLECDTLTEAPSYAESYIAKYDPNGNCKWAANGLTVLDIALNPEDHILATAILGHGDTVVWGQDSLFGFSQGDALLMELNKQGQLQWATKIADNSIHPGNIIVRNTGEIYVSGTCSDSSDFNWGTLVSDTASNNVFLAKYDSTGSCDWVKWIETSSQSRPRLTGMKQDGAGNLYLTGSHGPLFGPGSIYFPCDTINIPSHFLAKFDSSGGCQWAQELENRMEMEVAENGDFFLMGGFTDSITIGNLQLHGTPFPNTGTESAFLSKLNSAGQVKWLKESVVHHEGFGLWNGFFNGRNYLALDRKGHLWFTGLFSGFVIFPNDTLQGTIIQDNYIAQYDTSGNFLYASVNGLPGPNSMPRFISSIGVGPNNELFFGGGYTGPFYLECDTLTEATTYNHGYLYRFLPPSAPYAVDTLSIPCTQSTVGICLSALDSLDAGIWGLSYCLEYDTNAVHPTGNFTLGSVVTGSSGYTAMIDTSTPGQIYTAIYLSGSGINYLAGTGEVVCLEFDVLSSVQSSYTFPVCQLTESFDPALNTALSAWPQVSTGILNVVSDDSLKARLVYRNDTAQPVGDLPGFPLTAILPTQLNNGVCTGFGPGVAPDSTGRFELLAAAQQPAVQIVRDIPNSNPVMNVINSADANRTFGIWTGSYASPNLYELLSADADGDGRILVGDMSAINARSVMTRQEFIGLPDWYFLSDSLVNSPAYLNADKNSVPRPPDCLTLSQNSTGGCTTFNSETFHGVLIGDVDGSWSSQNAGTLKMATSSRFEIRVTEIEQTGNDLYRIPVYVVAVSAVQGMDLDISFDPSQLEVVAIEVSEAMDRDLLFLNWNAYQGDRLLVTAGVQSGWTSNEPAFFLDLRSDSLPQAAAFTQLLGYMEGAPVPVTLPAFSNSSNPEAANNEGVQMFPNPTTGLLTIRLASDPHSPTKGTLLNSMGQQILSVQLARKETQLNFSDLPEGIYFLRVFGKSIGIQVWR